MQRFPKRDRVRVDIPDETDLDHQEYHEGHGRTVAVVTDDMDSFTVGEQNSQLYRVAFDSGEAADSR